MNPYTLYGLQRAATQGVIDQAVQGALDNVYGPPAAHNVEQRRYLRAVLRGAGEATIASFPTAAGIVWSQFSGGPPEDVGHPPPSAPPQPKRGRFSNPAALVPYRQRRQQPAYTTTRNYANYNYKPHWEQQQARPRQQGGFHGNSGIFKPFSQWRALRRAIPRRHRKTTSAFTPYWRRTRYGGRTT